jgi:flagellar hook-length control protein FliK
LPAAAPSAEPSAILAAPAKGQPAGAGSSAGSADDGDNSLTFQAGLDAALAAADKTSPATATAPAAAAAAATAASAGTAATQLRVDTPVGSRNWTPAVADKVLWMVGQQQSKAELVLNPPQMGRIEVSLTVSGDQAKAVFISANPEVRQALDGAMSQLREVLLSAGINLGQTHVGADSAGYSSSGGENADNSNRGQTGTESIAGVSVGGSAAWLRTGRGLVDTFA